MNFDELDARMRIYETAMDQSIIPGVFIVARLDGRGFTRLTKETLDLHAPFDERFRDAMALTVEHLMQSGPRVVYAYTQSDEISLLFARDDDAFSRMIRQLLSVLAGEASACFSVAMGIPAAFDCRLSVLPDRAAVVDYFRWRQEDAHRNALNAHCYWMLRSRGGSAAQATARLSGMSISAKNELLFESGINFNDLPAWQRRGIGCSWETYEKQGTNPKTGEMIIATRRRIERDLELPMREAYTEHVRAMISP